MPTNYQPTNKLQKNNNNKMTSTRKQYIAKTSKQNCCNTKQTHWQYSWLNTYNNQRMNNNYIQSLMIYIKYYRVSSQGGNHIGSNLYIYLLCLSSLLSRHITQSYKISFLFLMISKRLFNPIIIILLIQNRNYFSYSILLKIYISTIILNNKLNN